MAKTGASIRDQWIINTTTGPVKGHAETGVAAFRGIPYAAPPVGELRFRRAQPIEPWEEVFHADASGHPCPQYHAGSRRSEGTWEGDEDCLWLNVVVPRDTANDAADAADSTVIDTDAKRPVVVYIHGGSNVHGSAASPMLSGEYFATSIDCVYVGVNYRVGILGQMSLGYGTYTSDDMDTNPGHSDLVTAIRWVHDNAAAFGGDPGRITIMGESSGGSMVSALLATPQLEGIISAGIAQSPAATIVHTPTTVGPWVDFAARWYQRMVDEKDVPPAKRAPVNTAPPELDGPALKKATEALLQADAKMLGQLSDELVRYQADNPESTAGPFAPLVDGDLLPRHPLEPGAMLDVPLLVGSNRNEYDMMRLEAKPSSMQLRRSQTFAGLFAAAADAASDAASDTAADKASDDSSTDAAAQASAATADLGPRGLQILREHYKDGRSRSMVGRFFGDAIFTAPAWRMASNHPSGHAWVYRLDTTTPFLRLSGIGSMHALDLPILFQRYDLDKGRVALLLGGRDDFRITTAAMHNRWRRFIHHRDPGFDPYCHGYATQIFDSKIPGGERTEYDPQSSLRQAWEKVNLVL
ncbi:carboxylesterase family protein [Corynebacterium falsenii]|uniref:carboxylesterase family protein n=1 Tax=Corynebacterium falsenii TaxID=108486 RepID=UPI00234DADBB|nr:carboxylesterase family protein [Corynebacterium falsenii]MDC7104163.1 carboxylesterase family protein [Corynebacterium falsenii]